MTNSFLISLFISCITVFNCYSQTKKEQIEVLNSLVDSLKNVLVENSNKFSNELNAMNVKLNDALKNIKESESEIIELETEINKIENKNLILEHNNTDLRQLLNNYKDSLEIVVFELNSSLSNDNKSANSVVTFCLEKLDTADLPENSVFIISRSSSMLGEIIYPELFWTWNIQSNTRNLYYKCDDKLFQLAETSSKEKHLSYNAQGIETFTSIINFENENYEIVITAEPLNLSETFFSVEILVTEKNNDKLALQLNYWGEWWY